MMISGNTKELKVGKLYRVNKHILAITEVTRDEKGYLWIKYYRLGNPDQEMVGPLSTYEHEKFEEL